MTYQANFSDDESWIAALSALVKPDEVIPMATRGWTNDHWAQQRQQSYPQRIALSALAMAPELREAMHQAGITSGMKVLDAGCGVGVISRFLWQTGAAEVIGVDYDDAMLAQAEALPNPTDSSRPLTFIKADLQQPLPFESNSFDVVWLGDLWLPNLMAELQRLVRPGGRIIFKSGAILPRLTYTWDMGLDARFLAAFHHGFQTWEASLEQYRVERQQEKITEYGRLKQAGFTHTWSQLVERFAPIPPLFAEELRQRFALWEGPFAWPYLDEKDREQIIRLWQPESEDYILSRTDGHFTQVLTLASQVIED